VRGFIAVMEKKRRKVGIKADGSSASLMYTINAISHLSRDEFELLKKLRSNSDDLKNIFKRNEIESLPEVQKIIKDFNVKSIRDVIEIMENFKLFEIYHF
jgi:hypothetical protein